VCVVELRVNPKLTLNPIEYKRKQHPPPSLLQVRAPAKGVFLRAFHAAYGRYFYVYLDSQRLLLTLF